MERGIWRGREGDAEFQIRKNLIYPAQISVVAILGDCRVWGLVQDLKSLNHD